MKKLFYPLFLAFTASFLLTESAGAQSVDCPIVTFPSPTVSNVLTLPCGAACTSVSANFPDIRNTNTYIVDSPSYSNHQPFVFSSGATQVIVNQDDIYSASVSLPFTFCFYGVSYTSVAIGANGILAFPGTTFGGTYCPYNIDQFSNYGTIPSTAYYDKPAIFGPFHDIDPSKTASNPRIEYKLIGTAPCRQLVVNYSSIRHYGSSCGAYNSTFQIILYENTNVIEIYIQDKPACPSWNNGKAILGVHNAGGTQAVTAPGKNATVWGSTGMNKCYRFIPNGSSLLNSVQLIQNGSVIATTTATTQSPGVLTSTFTNVCPASDTSKYTIKANYTACSGAALTAIDSITIIKKPIPAAPAVATPVSYCVGQTPAPLSATGTGILWYTSMSGGSGTATATPSTTAPGTFYWYASQTVNGCESPRATVTVNVNALPAAPGVTSPVNYCVGQMPVPLTATGTNLKWYTVATGGTPLSGAPTPSTGVAGTYTWYVSQTTSNCEGSRAAVVVNVNALPTIVITPGVANICAGQTINLVASGATSYTWSPATGLNTTSGSTVDAGPLTTTTYTVTGTNSNNCSSTAAIVVNVTPLPVVTASSNSPVCTGGTILLTSTSNPTSTAFGWTGPNGFTSTLQNPSIPNATTANSGTYYVTATVNSCTSSPAAMVDVTVNPTLTSNATAQICPGGSVNFGGTTISSTGIYTHTFTSGAGCDSLVTLTVTSSSAITTSFSAAICSGSSYTFNGTAYAASGSYNANFTAVNGCDSISTLNLMVNPVPAAPTAISPVTYCQFAAAAPLTASGNGTLLWYNTATGGVGSTTAPVPATGTPGSTTWYVSQMVGICESGRTAIVVNVTAQPAPPTVISPRNYCLNSTPVQLTAGGTNLLWYGSAIGGTGSNTAPATVTSATGSTTYYVSQTVNGCESQRAAITVIINALPVVTVTPASATICAGQSTTLNAGGASTYSWSPASGLSATTGATVTASPAATATYTVTGTSAAPASCAATANVTITVNPIPVITASSNSPVCTGGTLNLSASNVGGATYAWTGPSGFNAATQNPFINSVSASNAGTYSVTATLNNCTSTAATTNVVVNPLITSTANAALCPNSSITFGGTTINGAGTFTHTFTTGGGCDSFVTLHVTVNNAIATSITASICQGQSYAFAGTAYTAGGTYSATYMAANGCDSVSTLNLTVNPLPVAPGVSSPLTYCQYSTAAALSANGSGSLLWYTTATGGAGSTSAPIPSTSVPGSTTWYVSQTTNGCEGPRAAITVNVTAQPAAPTVGTPVIYCQTAAPATLSAGGSNLLWYLNATGGAGASSPPAVSTATTGNTTYYVSQTVNGCESPRAAITVTVNPKPVVTVTPATATICNGQNVTLNAGGANTYSWTPATGLSSTVTVQVTASPTGTTTYVVTGTNAFNCSATASATITVNPVPVVTASSNSPVCAGQTLNLTASGVTGGTFAWSGPNAFSSTQQNPTLANATTSAGGTYTVTATLNNCTSLPSATNVIVNPTKTSSLNVQLCNGSNYVFGGQTISSAGTYTHVFSTTQGCDSTVTLTVTVTTAIATSFSAAICQGQSYSFNGTAYTTGGAYTAHFTAVNGCDSASTLNLTVNPLPAAPGVVSPVNYCVGAPPTALTATGSNLKWYTVATGGTPLAGTPTPSTSVAGTFTWYVSQTTNGCEGSRATIVVNVNANPVLSITPASATICNGQSTVLTASGATTYIWTGTGLSANTGATVTASPTAPTTYTVTGTANGCSATATVTVTVNPVPVVTVSSNTPVCSGNSINLTATAPAGSTYAWTGPNSFSSAQQNPSIANAATAAAGTYSVTATLNGCASAIATTNVAVNPTPVITGVTATDQTQCTAPNGTITLSGLTPGTLYSLSYLLGGNTITNNYTATAGGTIVLANLPSGTYSGFIAGLNGCSSAATGSVTIAPPPGVPAPVAGANSPCTGSTLSLTASTIAGATYSWAGPNGFTSSQQNPTITNAAATIAGAYSVTATVNGCISPPGTVTVIVKPTPALVSVSSNSPVCAGNTLSLTAQSGTAGTLTYAWTGPNGFTSSTQNPAINNATVAAAGTYSVTASLNGCSSANGTTTVIVNPLPAAPGVANVSYCQGAAASVLTANGTGLLWYTAQTGGTPLNGAPLPSTATVMTYTWYVSQTANGCEGPRAAIMVTINPKPAPPAAPATITYCQYENPAALSATGTDLLWYMTPTGGTGTAIAPTPLAVVPGTFHYYVSQSNGSCESDRTMITVVVNAKPAPPGVTPVIVYCQGDAAAALSANGTSLKWYTTQSGGTGAATPPLPNTQIQGTTIYYVTQTVSGCESDRSQIKVTVHEKPNGIILATHHALCQSDTLTFYYFGSAPAGSVYNWHFPQGSTVMSGSGQGPFIVAFNTPGNFNVTLQVDDSGCLSGTAAYNVNVRPLPALHMVYKQDVCVDERVTIALNSASNNLHGFVWNFAGAQILSSTPDYGGPFVVQWHQPGTYTITVSATNGECAAKPDTGIITVHELPVASILNKASFGDICATDTITLQAQAGVGYEYHWSPEAFFDGNGTAVADARVQFTGTILLSVQNEWMCSSKDSVAVQTHPCCTVSLPSAFSPNGDGKNDLFRIISPAVQRIANFRIVNRWGQVVWETLRPGQGWNGTYNGEPQGNGVYYYFIRYQCSDGKYYEQKGEFTLLR